MAGADMVGIGVSSREFRGIQRRKLIAGTTTMPSLNLAGGHGVTSKDAGINAGVWTNETGSIGTCALGDGNML
jgi:hypothetical protein